MDAHLELRDSRAFTRTGEPHDDDDAATRIKSIRQLRDDIGNNYIWRFTSHVDASVRRRRRLRLDRARVDRNLNPRSQLDVVLCVARRDLSGMLRAQRRKLGNYPARARSGVRTHRNDCCRRRRVLGRENLASKRHL